MKSKMGLIHEIRHLDSALLVIYGMEDVTTPVEIGVDIVEAYGL